jgi:hypothetical protein
MTARWGEKKEKGTNLDAVQFKNLLSTCLHRNCD